MPDRTDKLGLPYPLDTDPVNVAVDIQKLAESIDDELGGAEQDITNLQNAVALKVNRAGDTMTGTLSINAPSTAGSLVLRRSGGGPYMLFDTFPSGTDFGIIQGNASNMLYRASPTNSSHIWQIGTTEQMRLSPGGILDVNQVRADVRGTFGAPNGFQVYIVDTQGPTNAPQAAIYYWHAGTVAAPTNQAGYLGWVGSTTMYVRNLLNSEMRVQSAGDLRLMAADDVMIANDVGTLVIINGNYALFGKAASDLLQVGVEIVSASGSEGAVRSTVNTNTSNFYARHMSAADAVGMWFIQCVRGSGSVIGGGRQNPANAALTEWYTGSDYRMKVDKGLVTDGLDRVMRLKVHRYSPAEGDTTAELDGFFAHEFAEVFPHSVTGDKDAVNDDGEPEIQLIAETAAIPTLVAAVQELNRVVVELIIDNRELVAQVKDLEQRCCNG